MGAQQQWNSCSNVTKTEVAIFEWEYQINFDSFFGWGINMYNE